MGISNKIHFKFIFYIEFLKIILSKAFSILELMIFNLIKVSFKIYRIVEKVLMELNTFEGNKYEGSGIYKEYGFCGAFDDVYEYSNESKYNYECNYKECEYSKKFNYYKGYEYSKGCEINKEQQFKDNIYNKKCDYKDNNCNKKCKFKDNNYSNGCNYKECKFSKNLILIKNMIILNVIMKPVKVSMNLTIIVSLINTRSFIKYSSTNIMINLSSI
ncbi:hypothetical protein NAPIS_ORF00867 [Vairimorpha apis BRL 01]|uniref:Uncharacterized protein n=1 Tax=Vairimorpha apis BRL 01 TaxID=1037528 RepID=T0MKP2_9MICR|nr:hypothetical protein NAPIS_ORF00867 [Vairimorpha apis BRL 01]